MALINSEELIIRKRNLSPFHGLNPIRMIYKESHTQPGNLSSCHEIKKPFVFLKNRHISRIICHLTLILQGGIALFAIFSTRFRFSQEIAQNGKESVALPYLGKDLGFSKISFISRNNLLSFHEMACDRMFSGKSHNLNSELMSSRCVGYFHYVLRKIEYFIFQINVYCLCRV